MWEAFEEVEFDCDECGGSGPPPKFLIPPPPRPQFMQELLRCKDDDLNVRVSGGGGGSINSDTNSISNWDSDMCEAIPILDASYHSSPTLQTSAMIAVFSLLLVLVVLVSSLFVWKHKRKVQNFLPCKTPTRDGHLGTGVPGGHSVTYEDPDAHLGHRPLVIRHHHNVEMLHHSKAIHYPSGYPMTRSPPLFVCSSPGPDPYRSNDNVYEELGPARDSDAESEPALQSDDDFAEDELSLPGERSFNKSSPIEVTGNSVAAVSTIYHERIAASNLHERNSLLTSSGGNSDSERHRCASGSNSKPTGGLLSGVFRHTTGRQKSLAPSNTSSSKSNARTNKYHQTNHNTLPYHSDSVATKLSTLLPTSTEKQSDIVPPMVYSDTNNRNNLMALAYNNNNFSTNSNNISNSSNLNNNNNNNNNNSGSSGSNCNSRQHQVPNCYNALESEVERRNRINNQLHQPPPPPPVATIFRGTSRYPQPYYTHYHGLLSGHQPPLPHHVQARSRTNPRSLDRRRIIVPKATQIDEPNYGYAEPVFHEGLLYNHHHGVHHPTNPIPGGNTSNAILRQAYPSYILPDYTSGPYRTLGNNHHQHNHHMSQQQQQQQHHHHQQPQYHYPTMYNQHSQDLLHSQQPPQAHQHIYSRDSSFGSDSGYSHHTQGSSLTGAGSGSGRSGCNSIRTPTTPNSSLPSDISSNGGASKLSGNSKNVMNCIWNRKIPSTETMTLATEKTIQDNNLLPERAEQTAVVVVTSSECLEGADGCAATEPVVGNINSCTNSAVTPTKTSQSNNNGVGTSSNIHSIADDPSSPHHLNNNTANCPLNGTAKNKT